MSVWYTLSAFALIFVATGFFYWVLATNLHRGDIRTLSDNLSNVRFLLRSALLKAMPLRANQGLPWTSRQQPQIYFRVLDERARVILETPGMSEELPAPTVGELISGNGVSREVASRSGKLFQILSARIPADGTAVPLRFVQVAMDRDKEERLLGQFRERLWLGLSMSLIACSLLGYGIARGCMRPIESIGRTAERIRLATLHERIATTGLPAELFSLAGTFNKMLDRLEESFAHISQFSDDVAHELRTPVSNLRGEIEVALSKARSNKDYREILGSCLEECARLSRVIHSLLFLARAEGGVEPLHRDRIDVSKELATVREFYDAAAAEAGVELNIAVGDKVSARLNRTLFQQAVSNVVSNALAHTPEGGTVAISAEADATWLEVSVTDTGCGIPSQHLPRVLDRFYRVDSARSGSTHHLGLGLAVVKSIVELHGGRIEIASAVGRGTEVRLIFPR
jgi:two-component system heavy metal sensor histidine kinase CusS